MICHRNSVCERYGSMPLCDDMSLAFKGCSEFSKVDKVYEPEYVGGCAKINPYALDLIEFRTKQDEEDAKKHVFVSVSEEFIKRRV